MTHQRRTGGTGGPGAEIAGTSWDVEIAANTAAGTTDTILIEGMAMGSFHVPNGSSITSVTWYATRAIGTTPVAAKDEDGVAITQTVAADEVHVVPSSLAGCKIVAPVVDTAGTLYFHWER